MTRNAPSPAQRSPSSSCDASQTRDTAASEKVSGNGSKARGANAADTPNPGLGLYLNGVGRVSLLTPEDERDIARRMRGCEIDVWDLALTHERTLDVLGKEGVLPRAFAAHDTLARHARRVRRAAKGHVPSRRLERDMAKDRLALATVLREFDEDRVLIDTVILALRGKWRRDVPNTPVNGTGKESLESVRCRSELARAVEAKKRQADRVRNDFARANLRLVVSVARKFHHHRMPLIDMIQEGNLGLMKSVHRFDPERGFRFSTYAHWWIRQAIERAIMNKGAQIRLPVHVFDARRELAKKRAELRQAFGFEPGAEELAQAMNLPRAKVDELLRAVPREPASLHDPMGGSSEDRTLGEVIPDEDTPTPVEQVIRLDDARHIRNLLGKLSPMERDIIERRFGFVGGHIETLEQIGKSYSLSRERVRQIQVQCLQKMRRLAERQAVGA